MGIDVVVESEDGKVSGEVLDPRKNLVRALCVPRLEATVCLRCVDPFGDTVFNQAQIPHLISELQALRASITDASIRAIALESLEAAKRAGWAASIIRAYEAEVAQADSRFVS
jgi:hypothetical protein